jgi:SAM-dependent methyltransferase
MKLNKVFCPICGQKNNFNIVYPANFKFSDLNVRIFSARRLPDKIHYRLVKCKKCGLVRSNPVADIKHLNKLYQRSLMTYDEEINNLVTTYIKSIRPILNKLPKDAKILEIGCGSAFVLKALYKLGYKNLYGIEPSTNAIKKVDSKIVKNIKINILKPKLFPKDSFDFIFFFQTFDHIPNPNQFLKECYRLLKKDGYILSFNHNIDSLSAKLFGEKSPIIDIEHTFLYSPNTIKNIFEKNKFIVRKIFSPYNILSLKHFFWLIPMPQKIKQKILSSNSIFLNKKIRLQLGNLCLIAQKQS